MCLNPQLSPPILPYTSFFLSIIEFLLKQQDLNINLLDILYTFLLTKMRIKVKILYNLLLLNNFLTIFL